MQTEALELSCAFATDAFAGMSQEIEIKLSVPDSKPAPVKAAPAY